MKPGRILVATRLALLGVVAVPAPRHSVGPGATGETYRGIDGATSVEIPRSDGSITIDGRLDETAWASAAVLTGFSQYRPVDGLPAEDATDVLVWYDQHALYIGIRASEPHGPVNTTLADRDRIFGDDYTQILLDPFHDGRRALLFAVNPLGVQADGTQSEEQRSAGGYFSAEEASAQIDLRPDYVFDSHGRITDEGYEVEIRIPFKSLRYPAGEPQTWGINVVRQVQHSGSVQTWTPVRRGETSFLAQGGTLEGLTGMSRGLVLDLNPEITNQVSGAPVADGWSYDRQAVEWGGNLRWGITTNLTANATANPDFSQVEADAAQIAFDPRQALSYPEKRPFFLEGAEQFAAPSGLIYTRRIVDPVGAAKLAGKVGGTDVGFLSAVDDDAYSGTGLDHPVYNLLRVRHPVGEQSVLGLTWTDRVEGVDYNRVGSLDARIVRGAYTFTAVGAASRTRTGGAAMTAPLWSASVVRSGRAFGWSFSGRGSSADFFAGSGFQSRPGISVWDFTPRLTRFGEAGSRVESWSTSLRFNGTWLYDRLGEVHPDEAKLHFNNSLVLRGGWNVGLSFLLEQFLVPRGLYDGYAIDLGTDTVPFVGRPTINNYDFVFSLGTPQFPTFSAGGFIVLGRDDNFAEWAPGWIMWVQGSSTWRPTERVRVEGNYSETRVLRTSDWSRVTLVQVPRLKLEYQLARPLFVRLVGQYYSQQRDVLRDDGRTGAPIVQLDPSTGTYAARPALAVNDLRFDALFSYRPTPGTVVFFGYGSDMAEERAFRFQGLDRRSDAFFVKLSYLFRM